MRQLSCTSRAQPGRGGQCGGWSDVGRYIAANLAWRLAGDRRIDWLGLMGTRTRMSIDVLVFIYVYIASDIAF